ncbi:hypothetical protein [Nocardioides soli]|uniref:Uncharacterized protein n=1 Tax=Nocardioides soli TaxID=1036020 RepID=A0A7W4VX40_9ACTN|nr:hypothetical protein [Nocardioides soli]MBB3043389.1 hypothetical protein [Nocardioides soli]
MNNTDEGPHMDLDDFRARLNEAVAHPPPMPTDTLWHIKREGRHLVRQHRLEALVTALLVIVAAALLTFAR